MRIISGIYVIRNKKTNKVYIGSSHNIHKRFNQHKNDLNNGRHYNMYLQRAWDKHGAKSFEFKILERCDVADLLEREQFWIDRLQTADNGYNLCKNTTSPMLGRTFSDESRQRMSKAQTGRKHSEETKQKIRDFNLGKKLSPEHVAKISAVRKGQKASEETRVKLRAVHNNPSPELRYKFGNAMRGKHRTQESLDKAFEKRAGDFIVTSPDGVEIEVKGLARFCRANGLDQGMMSRVIKSGRTHKGWKCRKAE